MHDRPASARRRPLLVLGVALAAGVCLPLAAQEPAGPETYLRIVEDDAQHIALEIATRDFVPEDGAGPRVGLVAVAHIGEQSFYDELQQVLAGYDVVLFESVLPPGARGPEGEDDAQRARSTEAAMRFVAGLLESHRSARRAYPATLDDLALFVSRRDARVADWQRSASVDAWGNDLRYETTVGPGPDGGERIVGFRLTSLGADGESGGEDADADLAVSSSDLVAPLALTDKGNLQSELAKALGLEFQLHAMHYGHAGWRCSDMTIDEVDRALKQRGLELDLSGDPFVGALPERIVRFLLRTIRFLDVFLEGAIADTCKVVMIEMLGDEATMERSLEQMGAGFAEVIVGMRNQVAVDDLRRLIEGEPEVGSVAIFYGAAHMRDLQQRLADQLGYRPAGAGAGAGDGDGAARWHRAMEVDLGSSAVPPEELQRIRAMVKQMMGGMGGR